MMAACVAGRRLDPERLPSDGERRLWFAVLWQLLFDLTAANKDTRRDAEHWLGARPSRDFVVICDLCGLDPEAAHRSLRVIRALPWEARHAQVRGALGREGPDRRRMTI